MMKLSFRPLLLFLLLPMIVFLPACEEGQGKSTLRSSVREEKVRPPVENPAREVVSAQEAFIEVSRKVTPAVVNIRAARVRQVGPHPWAEDLFEQFFRNQPRQPRKEQSLGSGFIITADGYLLTNAHVVQGAEEIKVMLSDQRVYDGKVVGIDQRTDVAVLKIEAGEELPAAVLGDSDQLQVGQWALAIGNPFGLDRTLTVGVISATRRNNVGIEDYEDFIQTDASINPGNSGGPLLNIYGEVVGINTAIVAAGQGIGFAIPINLARLIADQLIKTGEVTRGWLGVSIQTLTPELAESFGLDRITGALVNQVMPDSPAAQGGVQRGDVLLAFDGKEIAGVRELQLLVASTPVGRSVELQVLRGGKRLTLQVTIVPQAAAREEGAPGNAEPRQPASAEGLGLSVIPAEEGAGVQVAEVDPQSRAAQAGVRPGDAVLSINGEEIRDLDTFRRAVRRVQGAKSVVLLLQRGGQPLYLAFPNS